MTVVIVPATARVTVAFRRSSPIENEGLDSAMRTTWILDLRFPELPSLPANVRSVLPTAGVLGITGANSTHTRPIAAGIRAKAPPTDLETHLGASGGSTGPDPLPVPHHEHRNRSAHALEFITAEDWGHLSRPGFRNAGDRRG